MCILCPDKPPPEGAKSKNQGGMQNQIIGYQNNPNTFQVAMKDACCKDPLCCCIGGVGAACGFSACWARKTVLETKLKGIDDFICFQGYLQGCGPCKPPTCAGSPVGLCLEGCCCPVMSISIARIHIMDLQQIRPDPMDYQIIQCSNFLQLLACVCQIAAIVCAELRDLANLIDCIANAFTLSAAGCMISQINTEIKYINANGQGGGGGTFVATAVPIVQGQPMGAPPAAESMER